jgi:ATP-dependent protease ClpP protease subunit
MKKLVGLFVGLALFFGVATSTGAVVKVFNPTTIQIADVITLQDAYTLKVVTQHAKVKALTINIMSPGGNAFAMISIKNTIMRLKAKGIKIITVTDGLAFSAGAIIWLLGDERIMHADDLIMFHGVQTYIEKDGKRILKPEKDYDKGDKLVKDHLDGLMLKLLTKYLGKDARSILKSDTYYTAQQALALGLATKIIGG